MENLKASREYATSLRMQEEVHALEEKLILKLTDRFHLDDESPKNLNKKWWSRELQKLKKLENKNPTYNKMLSRLTYKLGELAYTRSRIEYFQVTPVQKAFRLFLLTELKRVYKES